MNQHSSIAAHIIKHGDAGIKDLAAKVYQHALNGLRNEMSKFFETKNMIEARKKLDQFNLDYPGVNTDDLEKIITEVINKDINQLSTYVSQKNTKAAETFIDNNEHVRQDVRIANLLLEIKAIKDEALKNLELKVKKDLDENKTKDAKNKESQKKEAIPKDSATEKGKNTPASSEAGKGGGG